MRFNKNKIPKIMLLNFIVSCQQTRNKFLLNRYYRLAKIRPKNPLGSLIAMPQNAVVYSSRLYDAIELAARAHHNQVRKGTEIPYIVHPLAVAGWLIRYNCPEYIVISALLHDVIEDTPVSIDELRSHFGREVAELVVALSEPDKKAPWEERKAHTIDYLEKQANEDVLLIALADKLDNIRAIREGLESDGDKFWNRFNRPRDKQKWYYERLAAAFSAKVSREPALTLLAAFKAEVKKIFE